MTDDALWTAADGTRYTYKVFRPDAAWNHVPANYIFATGTLITGWKPLYIGQTGDLSNRMGPGHPAWETAREMGMTHIHAHTSNPDEAVRRLEESNLIRHYKPALNYTHVPRR